MQAGTMLHMGHHSYGTAVACVPDHASSTQACPEHQKCGVLTLKLHFKPHILRCYRREAAYNARGMNSSYLFRISATLEITWVSDP